MANEKILNTRIQLKYDSYKNWVEKNPTLLSGEIAIAYLPPRPEAEHANPAPTAVASATLIKVGPGQFNALPWLSATAADVYDWAKKENPDWNDFPALPIEVVESGSGKFITDVEYANNKITISRSDVDWNDVKNAPDFALKSELPTELGVMSVSGKEAIKAEGDANVEISLLLDNSGNVELSQSVTGLKAGIDLSEYRKIADDENTAHTHSDGVGVKVTGNGGIDGIVKIDLDVKFNSSLVTKGDKKYLQLLDATDSALITEFDVTEFVKDGMLDSVTVDEAANKITFVWNTDGNKTETVVELSKIADIYTAQDTDTIDVEVSNEHEISASVKASSLKDAHIAADAAIAETKLAQGVQDALGLARTALQEHQSLDNYKTKQAVYSAEGSTVKTVTKIEQNANGEVAITYGDIAFPAAPDYTDEFAGKKDKQTAVANKISDAAHVLTSLSQDENGDIAYEVKKLTPADIGAAPAGNYKVTQTEKAFGSEDHKWVNSITQNANGEIEATLSRPSAYDLEEVSTAKNANNEDVPCLIFYCGTASDLV